MIKVLLVGGDGDIVGEFTSLSDDYLYDYSGDSVGSGGIVGKGESLGGVEVDEYVGGFW